MQMYSKSSWNTNVVLCILCNEKKIFFTETKKITLERPPLRKKKIVFCKKIKMKLKIFTVLICFFPKKTSKVFLLINVWWRTLLIKRPWCLSKAPLTSFENTVCSIGNFLNLCKRKVMLQCINIAQKLTDFYFWSLIHCSGSWISFWLGHLVSFLDQMCPYL